MGFPSVSLHIIQGATWITLPIHLNCKTALIISQGFPVKDFHQAEG